MLFLKNFLLLILYLSDQHRLRLHISQKVPESIDLQNYDNESVLAIVIQPMVNYSSTSVRSLMINTTGSTPELTTVHIGIRNNVYDSNNYNSFRENNSRTDQKSVTVDDKYVQHIDIDAMQRDDPRVYGENNVTTQKPTDYDHNTTKNDSTDECYDSFEQDNSKNDQESVIVHDEHKYDPFMFIDIDAMQGDDPRVYGENNVTTQTPADYDQNITKNDSSTDDYYDSFREDNARNDQESVTVLDEQVYDIDIDAMQGDDPRVYGENNVTTQKPTDYDHNTTKNDSTDECNDSEDNARNDQESVTVHDEHVYDLNINAMPGDDPTVYGENNVTTQKPTDYDHNSTKNDSSTDECYNSRNNQKSGNDYYEHLAYFRKLIQNSISKSNSPKQTGSEEIYNEIDENLPVMFNHSENIVTSPISAMILMFMGSYGACSCTKDTINLAPNLPAGIRRDRVPIKSFIQELNLSKPNGTLMGHKIFIADNVVVSKKFSEILEQVFKSKLQQIDFTNALEAAQLINNWSANQTNDSITNVVDPYQFNNETGWICIYPLYINSKKTRAEGRKLPKSKCVENPTHQEIRDVLIAAGLKVGVENKLHPRERSKELLYRGRIRVQLKNDDGTPLSPNFPTRDSLLNYLGTTIPNLKVRQGKQTSSEQSSQQSSTSSKKGKGKGRR
ncbi:hypothetical protein PV325_001156 [Microctonus aethiopoides]|nr:hypothetical protein PV325_001156 [Microctonus aethiopoides]